MADPAAGMRGRETESLLDLSKFSLTVRLLLAGVALVVVAAGISLWSRTGDLISAIIVVLVGLTLTPVYLVPTFLADRRRHRQFAAIAIVNIAAGWSLLGWGACLYWALNDDQRAKQLP